MVARTIKADPERVQNSGAAPDIGTYVNLIERLPEPAMLSDRHGIIAAMNRAGLDLLETDVATTVVGRSVFSFLAPAVQALAATSYQQSVTGGTTRRSYEMVTLQGHQRTIEVLSVPLVVSAAGQTELMLGLARDVTEQRRAEQARDYLAAIVESSDDAIVSIDPAGLITAWNRGAEHLFGFTAAEAIGQPFTITVPPDMREVASGMVEALREHPEHANRIEVPCHRKDGSIVEVSLVAFAVRDHSGKLLGLSAVHRDITERKRAEREQALLAAIVESSQDAIITKAADRTILTWNAAAERLYGYRAEEVIGQPVTILTPPERSHEAEQVIERVLNGEKIRAFQTRRRHKDGHLIDVSLSEAPVRDRSGRIVGVAAIERDIGEWMRARHLEAQMAAIVKSTTDAIYSLGPGHIVQTWNPGAERMFGYRAEEVIGQRSKTMIPECQAQLDEMLQRVLVGETVEFESRRRRKDGVILDVAVTASPIYDHSGQIRSLAVITRDITEHKRAERALLQTESELRARVRQQVAVAQLGRIALSNVEPRALMAEAAELTAATLGVDSCAVAELAPDGKSLVRRDGWSAGAVPGAQAAVGLDGDPYAQYILRAGDPVIVGDFATETRFRRGSLLAAADDISGLGMVFPNNTQPLGIVAAHSKTAREFSRDDAFFIQAVAYMLGEVMQRHKAEQELVTARDEALESARAKSAFLANMSHEIRTPLNSIVGLSALLLETGLTSEQRDFAETIRVSSDILLETINNVLDFSRISSGKMRLEDAEFDLRVVTQAAIDLLADTARKKNLELALCVAEGVPRLLRGDAARLRQVLVNLLGNAVKFTAIGEVVLRVTLEAQSDHGVELRFEVKDTGIGIPPEAQRNLFQPFYQVDSSTTRRYGGSGLGLAICAQLVGLMGGKTGVKSQVGAGSTFWFTVPLRKAAMRAPSPQGFNHLTGLRVLVVDDNATNRQIVHRQMESWGMRADSAEGGAQALAMMRREAAVDPYAVAVVDMQMPEMDGLELAELIEADPALRKTRLVMMSSTGTRPDGDSRTAFFDTWFSKPVKPSELLRCLLSLPLGDRPAPSPAPAPPAPSAPEIPARGARILMAEDNPINQKVAVIQLRKLGYRPDVVGNGREALEALQRARYDLILMDCQMPEMDGYDATRQLRKSEQGSSTHTTVIALTAFGLTGDKEKCLQAGMDDYLAKPIKIEQLKEMLDRWLMPKAASSLSVPPPVSARDKSGA